MMDLGLSAEMVEIREKIRRFVEVDVAAVEHEYHAEIAVGDRWSHTPRQEAGKSCCSKVCRRRLR